MFKRIRTVWPAALVMAGLSVACSSSSAEQVASSEPVAAPSSTSEGPSVSSSPTEDPELLAWLDVQSKACATVIRPPKGTGGSQTKFFQGQEDQFRDWLRTQGKTDTPKEQRSELAKVVKLYEETLTATKDALAAYLKLTTTAIFPSEAAANAAAAEQRRTSNVYRHSTNSAQKALIAFSRHAGFDCAS